MNEKTFFEDWQSLIDDFEKFSKSENNPFFKSKYVPLKNILPVVKEKCRKHNFIFFQLPRIEDGKNTLQTWIKHKSGEEIQGNIELVSKDPNDPQKLGGAITYMRRYSLTCMFGLEEEDDDGNHASKAPEMSFEKACDLAKEKKLMCSECASDIEYYELKDGSPRIKCSKDGRHKGMKLKSDQKAEVKKIMDKKNIPF